MLFYGTGGLAIADADAGVTSVDGHGDPNRSDSNTHFGWVIGAGAEFKVTENMSFGAEYLHVDLGSEDYALRGQGLVGDTDILSERRPHSLTSCGLPSTTASRIFPIML